MTEQWLTIPSFPNYEASSLGRIRRVGGRPLTGVEALKGMPDKGYLRVTVYRDAKLFRRAVHSLVCEAFHGPRPTAEHEVAHRNGVKLDNTPANVRWATHAENEYDKTAHGTAQRGECNHAAILTEGDVREIRRLRASHMVGRSRARRGFYKDLAEKFGVHPSTIGHAASSKNWRHL